MSTQFQEGDDVTLLAKVARINEEQALVEFTSMEGVFSVRVPVSEILPLISKETGTPPSAGSTLGS